jgi:hypothetical protein
VLLVVWFVVVVLSLNLLGSKPRGLGRDRGFKVVSIVWATRC